MQLWKKISATVLFLASATANASLIPLDVSYQGLNGGYKNISASVNGKSKTVSVGMLSFKINKDVALPFELPGVFDAFCIEFEQQVRSGRFVYSVMPIEDKFAPAQASAITALYTTFHTQATNLLGKMAFQLALWELVHDFSATNWSSLSLTNGIFKTTSKDASVSLANSWLSQIKDVKSLQKMYVMTNGTSQDQLIFTGVNPPDKDIVTEVSVSTGLMAGMFMLLIGLGLRKRKK